MYDVLCLVLFILLQLSSQIYSQEISFFYDEIIGNHFPQSDGESLINNIIKQIWNGTSSNWVNDSLIEYSYNNENLLDTFITHKWRYGTVWGNEYKATYNYNSNNKIILKTGWSWGGGWYESSRDYYAYYGSGNLLAIDYHSKVEGNWRYLSRIEYNWNEFNLVSMIAAEGLWIFYNYWGPLWKDEYSYDSTNSLIMKEKFVHYLQNHWEPDLRDLYFYENRDSYIQNIRQDWDDNDSIWVNDYRYLYEYNSNNLLISATYQDWQLDSLHWKNVWRESYTYTPQNHIATIFKETWAPETNWNNYLLQTYFYDTNYNWIERVIYLWNETHWKNHYRHLATWIEPVSVWETSTYINAYYLSNNYPNPFNPTTKINFQIPVSSLVTLKVYDILGNEIATLINEDKAPGSYEIEFDGAGLTSGMYFYNLKVGNFSTGSGQVYSETKKMILLK